MRAFLICAAALSLAACATHPAPEPKVTVQEVRVPIAIKCGVDPGPEPAYADNPAAIQAAPNIFARTQLVLAGRAQREARLAELRAAYAGCH